jgi:hypothetical protein
MSFESVALEEFVTDRITFFTHQQAQQYLRVLKLAVFTESDFSEIVFIFGLEIEGGHIVENHMDGSKDLSGVLESDPLDGLFVAIMQFIQEPVDGVDGNLLVLVSPKIVGEFEFAALIDDSGDHQMAKHPVFDGSKAHGIEKGAENQLSTHGGEIIVMKMFCKVQNRFVGCREKGKSGLTGMMRDPSIGFLAKGFDGLGVFGGTEGLYDTVLSATFIDDLDTDATALIGLFTHKHPSVYKRDTQI